MPKLIFQRSFFNGYLCVFDDGKTFVQIILTKEQQALQNFIQTECNPPKISFFDCFRFHPCRVKPWKRPHATCLNCILRAVLNSDIPAFFEVEIHQIWSLPNKRPLQKQIYKRLCSLAEMAGWLR